MTHHPVMTHNSLFNVYIHVWETLIECLWHASHSIIYCIVQCPWSHRRVFFILAETPVERKPVNIWQGFLSLSGQWNPSRSFTNIPMFTVSYFLELDLKNMYFKNSSQSSGWAAPLIGVSSHIPKSCGFDSCSEHISRLQVWFLVWCVWETTDWCFFLSLSPLLSLQNQ